MNCSSSNGCYQIYSIGDGGFLRQILDAVASINSSGDFAVSCGIGLLIGVIITFIRALLRGGTQIDIGSIFVSFLVYLLLFVPTGTVLVEDTYTADDYVIDNVPLGIAVPGHIISKLGFRIAELIDQGFSDPASQLGITRRPFLESITVINKLRDTEYLNALWAGLDQATGNNQVRPSVENYFKDCLMLKYQYQSDASIVSDSRKSLISLINTFPSHIYGTALYESSGKREIDCSAAAITITNWLNKVSPDLVNKMWYLTNTTDPNENNKSSVLINNAVNLLGSASVASMDYVRSILLEPLYQKANQGYFLSQQDFLSSIMINQAVSQRNIQWAAEQSMFMTTVRPFVTFFEGFIYAITPFAAVLICIGGFGLSIAVRYFQTLIWVQLWMPILAIINLYITIGARSEISEITKNGAVFDSYYAINSTAKILENYMATAGMLASSTPLIALFIVSAGSFTFTTIASRMSGRDHIDEKNVSPDMISQSPLLTNENLSSTNTSTGVVYKSRNSQLPYLSLNESDAQLLSSAYQSSVNTSLATAKSISENWMHGLSSANSYERAENIQKAVNAANNAELSSLWNKSVEEGKKTGTDASVIFMTAFEQLTSQSGSKRDTTSDRTTVAIDADADIGIKGGRSSRKTTAHEIDIPEVPQLDMPALAQPVQHKDTAVGAGGSIDLDFSHNNTSSVEKSLSFSEDESKKDSLTDNNRISRSAEQGRKLASSFNIADKQSLSTSLSKGIITLNRLSGTEKFDHGKGKAEEEKFMKSLSQSEQYQQAASLKVDKGWQQQVDLRSFAYDARLAQGGILEKIRSSVISNQENLGKVNHLTSMFQNQYGIADAATARDMAILSVAHNGTSEQKALTYALWSNLNAGDNSLVNIAPHEYQDNRSNLAKGENSFNHKFNTQTTGSPESVYRNLKQEHEEQKIAERSSEAEFCNRMLSGYQERFSDMKNIIDGYSTDAKNEIQNLNDSKVTIVTDSEGNQHYAIGNEHEHLSSGNYKADSMLGRGVSLLQNIIGENFGTARFDALANNISDVQRTRITQGLGQEFVEQIITDPGLCNGCNDTQSNEKLFSDELSAEASFMKSYAQKYHFDLNDAHDRENLKLRYQAFSDFKEAYNSSNGINLATSTVAIARIKELDDQRKDIIENSAKQDEIMLEGMKNLK